jgi:uncharacterized protein (DUF952 family)
MVNAESLHRDGIIGCSSAAQHAAVANHRFAGRTDLVLLLIDTDRLHSELRLEQAEADGQPALRVDGPVNLDAVFEAAPTGQGSTGASTCTRRPAASPPTAWPPWTRPDAGRSR